MDLFVLPLSDFDVVLEVNWLCTLGPILWDFTFMFMSFFQQGHLIEFHGIHLASSIVPLEINAIQTSKYSNIQLQKLLADFVSLFSSPTGLPPSRSCDHRIPLDPETRLVVVHPYRYPMVKKMRLKNNVQPCYNKA